MPKKITKTGLQGNQRPLTVTEQQFADCYLAHNKEPDIKRAVCFELQMADSTYYKYYGTPEIKAYIAKKAGQGFEAKDSQYNTDLQGALKLITLEGLLVEYSRLLERTFDPKDKKSILDSVRDMRHKFAGEMENQLSALVTYTDDALVDLFVETGTEILGNERARDLLRTLLTD